MILIIGGAASGKRTYARTLGYNDWDISQNVWALVQGGTENTSELLERLCKMPVVVCNEAGAGVVPISRDERERREAYGRLCIELASRAERVVRLTCGIPQVIKP